MADSAAIETVSPESVGLSSERLERVRSWLGDQISSERLVSAGGRSGLSRSVHRFQYHVLERHPADGSGDGGGGSEAYDIGHI